MKNEKNGRKNAIIERIYNEVGEVIANIITVDGVDVEVAEDVSGPYSQARPPGAVCAGGTVFRETPLTGTDGGG